MGNAFQGISTHMVLGEKRVWQFGPHASVLFTLLRLGILAVQRRSKSFSLAAVH